MKIHSLECLSMISGELRADGSRIVHAHGCFDALTIGHAKHLQAAKRLGDVLIVTVTPDEHVNKGPGRPIFAQNLRCQMLASLACIDYVAINRGPTAASAIQAMRPHVFVKGGEYRDKLTPMLLEEQEAVRAVGGELMFTDGMEFHSTKLIEAFSAVGCMS